MREQEVAAIVVMNHDDYRWFFGIDRAQPRAIIPASGAPALIARPLEPPAGGSVRRIRPARRPSQVPDPPRLVGLPG
jgi:Xaa-Pro aminopeptidase